MARRYDFAMQKHGKRKKTKAPVKVLDFQTMPLLKDPKESEYEASWRRELITSGKTYEDSSVTVDEDLPLTVHAVGIGEQNPNLIGQEFSGITDRITKVKERTTDSLKYNAILSCV